MLCCCSSVDFHGFRPPSLSERGGNSERSLKVQICRRRTMFMAFAARHMGIPLATSISVLLWATPVHAGFLSGFSGLEPIPGPQLPEIDFLKKWNEENQKKYAEFDSRFKSSKVLKELLEKSKLNKERNRRIIQDKYCLRGAEWGVGDCSTLGMTEEERDTFIKTLKKNIKE
ncbi:hypothetical protein HPP92_023640 [Vanilla planifolia]|uniref:Uncharacterized protein n=2 Tax=Vanilla planifolia TaxID=51239 RepID=A0A835UEN0_VANPL|nr:hypothetical protein HPP92_023640 [Vanilla planifolia]